MQRKRKRYAQVGVGDRSLMYTRAIATVFKDEAELVGLCDSNPGRLEERRKLLAGRWRGPSIPLYDAKDFDKMVKEGRPDAVIVTSGPDATHDAYIVRAMELGCDVVTEKPVAVDERRCRRIVDAARKTGRDVRVAFNYRYAPPCCQIKQLLADGLIGKVLSVDFQWALNTTRGADYFRRWHRRKENSGGLMVHEATHHFDLMNWWLAARPVEVYAMGRQGFYGERSGMAEGFGLKKREVRCLECRCALKCPFRLNLEDGRLKSLYLRHERHDGYIRDHCVFATDIDIEDSMNVVVRYETGALMSYCLNAFLPWEGYRVAFNGTKGRLEHHNVESVYTSGEGNATVAGQERAVVYYPHFRPPRELKVKMGKGGHGGGDDILLRDLFSPAREKDALQRAAGLGDGVLSALTGVAANISMETNLPVDVTGLAGNTPPASWETDRQADVSPSGV